MCVSYFSRILSEFGNMPLGVLAIYLVPVLLWGKKIERKKDFILYLVHTLLLKASLAVLRKNLDSLKTTCFMLKVAKISEL